MSYKYGDRSICVCFKCECVRTTTMLYRDVVDVVGDLQVEVKDILVGVCDTCDEVISIPQQSSDAIQEALNPEDEDEDEEDLCESCEKRPAEEPHTCPYSVDINDNYDECTCCSECESECAYDI